MHRCAFSVSIRKLFAIAVALTVLFAPAATSAGAAAAVPVRDQMLMMDHSAPCQMPPGGAADHHKGAGGSCCVSMCMAVAVAPPLLSQALPMRQEVAQYATLKSYHGLPAETATPPPRLA